jgi:HPt (histidine-containing phosphotransfer) domain-containing protein
MSHPRPHPRPFDDQELLERIDGDWEFLTETVQMLASDGPALVGQIRDSLAAGDASAVGRDAHSLKGMISNFCSPITQAAALEVENIGKSGDLSCAAAAVETLRLRVDVLIGALNDFLATRA